MPNLPNIPETRFLEVTTKTCRGEAFGQLFVDKNEEFITRMLRPNFGVGNGWAGGFVHNIRAKHTLREGFAYGYEVIC